MPVMLDIAPAHESVVRLITDGLRRVDERFAEQLASPIAPVAELCHKVERYRGKMLRPTLVLLSGLTAGAGRARESAITDAHVTIAAVIEMIHMATLVHDDVLDDADVRRGARTINHERGNETAVILGDYLISQSFHLCSQLDSQSIALRVGQITSTVCEGEMLQLHHRGDFELDEETYFEIIERKTASLIGAACELGAQQSGADADLAHRFYDFGSKLGVAFQIIDDLLDLIGDERTVGKSLGRDLEKGKLTLPLIRHLAFVPAGQREKTVRMLRAVSGGDPAVRRQVALDLEQTGSISHARRTASSLVERAKALLSVLPDSPARQSLLAMADAVVARQC